MTNFTQVPGKPLMTTYLYNLDTASIEEVLGDSKTAMVYGFQHCEYEQIQKALEKIIRVYDCSLGNDVDPIDVTQSFKHERLDKRPIYKIPSGVDELRKKGVEAREECKRICKSGLVNMVIKNYDEHVSCKNSGKEISPIVFCIDIDGNNVPLTCENMLSKTKKISLQQGEVVLNDLITHSELRRSYKIVNDPDIHQEMKKIAEETFKFVKVRKNEAVDSIDEYPDKIEKKVKIEYSLNQIDPPWKDPQFEVELKKRKEESKKQMITKKTCSWKQEMNERVEYQKSSRFGKKIKDIKKWIQKVAKQFNQLP